jgi:DNA primase
MKHTLRDDFIEHVRSQSDIVNVVSDYVTLKRKGKNYWGNCPFHGEKTPSFSVNPDKQFFYCFGCGTGGNVFTFVSKKEGMGFADTVKKLAQRAGVPIPEGEKTPDEIRREQERAELLAVTKYAASLFHSYLIQSPAAEEARRYLQKRGIQRPTMEKFQLGYAPADWDALLKRLTRKGFAPEVIEMAGLVLRRGQGTGFYDRFRSRVIFPIYSPQGAVIGFGGRVLDDSQPKYLNSPETSLFNKRHQLYGLHLAGEEIRRAGKVIVVEGYMDVITAHQHGLGNVVASLGTAFTPEQAKLLLKSTYDIYIAYDADAAGQSATLRGLGILSGFGANVRVISVPEGKDPDEFIRNRGEEAFLDVVAQAKNLIQYYLMQAVAGEDITTPAGKANVIKQIFPLLSGLKNEVEIDEYLRIIAGQLNVDEPTMRRMWGNLTKKSMVEDKTAIYGKNNSNIVTAHQETSAMATAEQDLIWLMLEDSSFIRLVMQEISPSMVNNEEHRQIFDAIFSMYEENNPITVHTIDMRLNSSARSILTRIIAMERGFDDKSKAVDGYIRYIRYNQRQQRITALEKKIRESELKGETVANDILTEYLQLVRDSKVFTENA